MLMKLSSNKKILIISAVIILLAGLFIFACLTLYNNLPFGKEASTPTPLLPIEQCNAQPESICLLFFARDKNGDTTINLYVPVGFPDFYLQVKRLTTEAVYECQKVEGQETNIICAGEALNLGEQIEITMISKDGEIPFAVGKFSLIAILVSSDTGEGNAPPLQTVTPASATQPVATPVVKSSTPTPTPTPQVSYPSYP